MNIRIAFVSLGCDKNLVDSEVMLGIIDREGYIITNNEEEADVIIVNTCGFILDATQEGVENVISAGEYKKTGRCKALIVTGCMAQRYQNEIFDELPEVDAVVGTGDFEKIVYVIKEVLEGKKVRMVTDINHMINEELFENRRLSAPGHSAYLKIAEGCDSHCTYCVIPSLRGRYRSRKIESLVREAANLCRNGIKELVLVAQDTALYGVDLYGEQKLHELLQAIAQLPEKPWIRLMYAYPEHITPEIIQAIADLPNVCKYIDMPIQHSETDVLWRMGRQSTRKGLIELINSLREKIPGIALRTTIMTGFPGETVEDFRGLYNFVKEIKFDRLGVFPYSREEGTKAALMPKQVKEAVKHTRRDRLMRLQQKIHQEKQQAKVGSTIDVMIDEIPEADNNEYIGRTKHDAYEVDAVVRFTALAGSLLRPGDIIKVTITESDDYDLQGGQYEPAK